MPDDAVDHPIPHDWSADQALAVVDFLERLAERIWSCYGLAPRDCCPGGASAGPPQQLPLPFPQPWWDHVQDDIPGDPDDDIPW